MSTIQGADWLAIQGANPLQNIQSSFVPNVYPWHKLPWCYCSWPDPLCIPKAETSGLRGSRVAIAHYQYAMYCTIWLAKHHKKREEGWFQLQTNMHPAGLRTKREKNTYGFEFTFQTSSQSNWHPRFHRALWVGMASSPRPYSLLRLVIGMDMDSQQYLDMAERAYPFNYYDLYGSSSSRFNECCTRLRRTYFAVIS